MQGKVLPSDKKIETYVIGALLIEKDAIIKVADKLIPEYFSHSHHQIIYRHIYNMYVSGQDIDISTVANSLKKTGELKKIGGAYKIASLTNNIFGSENINTHIHILRELYLKRELITLSSDIQNLSFGDESEPEILIDNIYEKLAQLKKDQYGQEKDILQITHETVERIRYIKENNISTIGIPAGKGFEELDKVVKGWQKSDLIILAGRPGMGKTAFVINFLCNNLEKNIIFFSLEMSSEQIVQRMICNITETELAKIKDPRNLSDQELQKIDQMKHRISESNITLADKAAINVGNVRSRLMVANHTKQIDMIVIDYMQLMKPIREKGKSSNRENDISQISQDLKAIAKDFNIPILCLSQLSRNVETRSDKRPQLSDLRESGAIEQDADIVIFLYRDAYYNKDDNNETEIHISKHRNGVTTDVKSQFKGEFMKFYDNDNVGNFFIVNNNNENVDENILPF